MFRISKRALIFGARAFLGAMLALLGSLLLAADSKPGQTVPVVSVVVYPQGLDQNKIIIPAGQSLFVVHHQAGLASIEMVLEQDNGTRIRDVTIRLQDRSWQEYLQLPAGNYVLSEANHPKWRCQITVTPAN